MISNVRRARALAVGLIVAAAVPTEVFATRAAISVRGRIITLELPVDEPIEEYDRTRDYDFEIMRDGLEFAAECLFESLKVNSEVVRVPGWRALMGLSTRLRQLDRFAGDQRSADELERRHYDRFLTEQRANLRPGVSFVRTNERMNDHEASTPLGFHLYARASVAWLRGYETQKLETWLVQRTQELPSFTLKVPPPRPSLVRAAEIIPIEKNPPRMRSRSRCQNELGGDNVVPFRRPSPI